VTVTPNPGEFQGDDGITYVVVPKDTIERRKIVTPTFILLVVCVVMNGVGLLGLWATNYYDSRRQERLGVTIDCNNAERLSELESGVSSLLGIPKNSIVIKPCLDRANPIPTDQTP